MLKQIKQESPLKLFLYFLITMVFLVSSFKFYEIIQLKNGWQYSDWLINYQGGFTRRGLIGEILFKIHQILSFRLEYLLFFTVVILYLIFHINLFKIIKNLKIQFIDLLIILSPLSFFYPVMESKVIGRKEIIFFTCLILMVQYLKNVNYKKQKYFIILSAFISSLSHSGLFLFSSYFLILFWIINLNKPLKLILRETIFIVTSLGIIFSIIIYQSLINVNISEICRSLSLVYENCGQNYYISTLNWSLSDNLEAKKIWNTFSNFNLFYLSAFIFCFSPIVYYFFNSEFKYIRIKSLNPSLLLIIPIISTIPIYIIASDWGRYYFWTYISSLLIYFYCKNNDIIKLKRIKLNNLFQNKSIIFIIIFLYGFTWTIPHCCGNNFKFIYKKPIERIL